ncbi:MAG: MFS transporter [Candidatus Heimdallarchaeota archaeon]|nr:MFS transporter [Candidatus Heimdallarchaeota archaeon]
METSGVQPSLESDEYNAKLSIIELTPVLIPYILGFFIFRGFLSNFPLYLQIKYDLTEIEVVNQWAIMSGIALFIGALTRVPAGILSDKIGRKKAFIIAYIVYAISLILIIQFSTNLIFIIALSTIRFGLNIIAMSGRSVVSASFRDNGLKNGLLSSMAGLGGFLGPALLAWILDNYPPDYIIYVSLGIILFDLILFTILLGVIPTIFSKIAPDQKMDLNLDPIESSSTKRDYSVLKDHSVQEGIFLFFTTGVIFGLITSVYSIYGFNVLGMSLTNLGLITGAGSLVQVIWAPIVGKLYQYVQDEIMRLIGWIMVLVSTFLITLSSYSITYFILGYFLLNFGFSAFITMEITRLNKTIKVDQFSLVFGITSSLLILGTSVAGFISPLFYGYSREGTFVASFGVAIISILIVIKSTLRIRKERSINTVSM